MKIIFKVFLSLKKSILMTVFSYPLPFLSKQDAALKRASNNNHKFLFAIDTPTGGKSYNSSPDIDHFLTLYQHIPIQDKHFNELIYGIHYEYYDLDFKLDKDSTFTPVQLFMWFDHMRLEWLNNYIEKRTQKFDTYDSHHFIINMDFNFLSKPNWIITTASDHTKISLHLVNRNAVFDDNTIFKRYYSSFKSYLKSFSNKHPFFNSIDFSVSSHHRLFRMTDSTKIGSTRMLKVFEDYHDTYVPKKHTFITDAINDKQINNKLVDNNILNHLFLSEQTKRSNNTVSFKIESPQVDINNNVLTKDIEKYRQLLSLFDKSRSDNYDDWIKVSFALKNANLPYDLFDEFSKRSSKYCRAECESHWKSIEPYNVENKDLKPVTLGSLHHYAKMDSPEEYKKLFRPVIDINIDFTPDHVIHDRFISDELYRQYLSTHDIVALKSNMFTGKTHSLPKIFNIFGRILIVYFRVSLGEEIYEKLKQYGFEFYSNIKGVIDLEKHNRVIIQIDSLHRVIGNTDLLILDEIESLHSHLCSSIYLDKQKESYSLFNYINKTPKIILADANLTDQTVSSFCQKKDIAKIHNTFQPFTELNTTFIHDKKDLIKRTIDLISNNKKVVIPSNSKRYCKMIQTIIKKKFPSLKICSIYREGTYTHSRDWDQYDVLIYTPTIVAGVSFDKTHFHSCCAYFINRSCNAEMSSQMLFRVRNLIDNNMIIFTNQNANTIGLPISYADIDDHTNKLIEIGHIHLQNQGLNIDQFNKKAEKNQYYKIYREFVKKRNMSYLFFDSYIKKILEAHGANITDIPIQQSFSNDNEDILFDMYEATINIKIQEATDIINATPITSDEFDIMKEERIEKTKDEQLSMTRHYLTSSYNLDYDHPLTIPIPGVEEDVIGTKWVDANLKHAKAFNNYKPLTSGTLDENMEILQSYHEQYNNKNLIEKHHDYDEMKLQPMTKKRIMKKNRNIQNDLKREKDEYYKRKV